MYGLSAWIEAVKRLSSLETGLLLLPMSIVSAVVAGLISKRNMVRGSLIAAAGFSTAASMEVLILHNGSSIIFIAVITVLFGLTMGTMAIGNQTALYKLVTGDQIGTASGLLRTCGYIGSIASSAIISIVFHKNVSNSGLHVIAIIMIVVSALALLLTVTDPCVVTYSKSSKNP